MERLKEYLERKEKERLYDEKVHTVSGIILTIILLAWLIWMAYLYWFVF